MTHNDVATRTTFPSPRKKPRYRAKKQTNSETRGVKICGIMTKKGNSKSGPDPSRLWWADFLVRRCYRDEHAGRTWGGVSIRSKYNFHC